MKHYKCDSDIGGVLIGNEAWTFVVPNVGGDGLTNVYVFQSAKEFLNSELAAELKFISTAQGTFGIFRRDCAYHELMRGEMTMKDALCVLSGRYGVFQGPMKVALVKRD